MAENATATRRPRLQEATPARTISPFVRATQLTAISLYWLPVSSFPVPFRQRDWLLKLLQALDSHFGEQQLLSEVFLEMKHTRTDLNRRFTQTLLTYEPVTGVLLAPGATLPKPPTSMEVKKLVDEPDANAEISIGHLAPDYLAWFLEKKGPEQREDFFGVGGMLFLWVLGDEANAPAPVQLPKALTTHPILAGHDFNRQLRKLHSMRAPWLKLSKEIFGQAMAEDAMAQGVPFVLPQMNANIFLEATEEQLGQWFTVFKACWVESVSDRGMLFAVGEPDFDERLADIVHTITEAHGAYKDV